MTKARIVGSMVSRNGVTLFHETGAPEVFTKDDWKTQAILESIMMPIAIHGVAEIDLGQFKIEKVIEKLADNDIKVETAPNGKTAIIVDGERIEDVGAIKTQVEAVMVDPQGQVGLKIFLREFAKVAKQRKHSADDLLAFMKRADLPIADDGSIIGYKVLRSRGDGFVSVHSGHAGPVPQRLGSIVQMPPEKVDPNRRQDCSHGLHVCSRSYIGGFSGDAVFLVKVAVGDVIAVPEYDTSKMRVARYQIVAQLPENARGRVTSNMSLTGDNEASALLRSVIAGDHPQAIEIVTDPGERGEIKVEAIKGAKQATKRKAKDVKLAAAQTAQNVKQLQKSFDEALTTTAKVSGADIVNAAGKPSKKFGVPAYNPLPLAKPEVLEELQKRNRKKPAAVETLGSVSTKKTAVPAPLVEVSADKIAVDPQVTRDSDRDSKLIEAQRLKDGGWSLREIEKHLGMCRKALGKKLR